MSDDSNKRQPLLEPQETTALLSPNTNHNDIDRNDSELSLSRLNDGNLDSIMTPKSSKNLNITPYNNDDEKNLDTSITDNVNKSGVLIRSLSPQGINEDQLEQHNNLMDINMTVSAQKSADVNSEMTEDDSQFYETQGGGKIYIDPSYIPRHFDDDNNNELDDLRKSTHNQIKLELDPSWTPFERYKSDLCFIFLSIFVDLCAIIITLYIFIVKDELGNETFVHIKGGIGIGIGIGEDDKTMTYPTGYEILRCLFIPLFVYIINRCLHFIISKSIKYLYLHGEKTLFVTLRSIEACNRHFIDICMVFVFGIYIYIICNYWYNMNIDENNIIHENGFDKFINESIWINSKHIDTKSITWFMFIIFMIIYVFDIYCSLHYSYIYYRFYNYARYNSIKQRGRKNKFGYNIGKNKTDTQSQEFDDENKQPIKKGNNNNNNNNNNNKKKKNKNNKSLGLMHINQNKSLISDGGSLATEPTISIMTLEDVHNINNFNYKDYNPHIHDDIITVKINKYNKKPKRKKKKKKEKENKENKEKEALITTTNISQYTSRHYSLFEENKIYKKSFDDSKQQEYEDVIKFTGDNSYSIISNKQLKIKNKKRRKRSRSESDLQSTNIPSSMQLFEEPVMNKQDSNNNHIMELREKINFLKATLFAKQSILDQFKLDLNEQTFIISNLSLKVKRIENDKLLIEKELMDKNEELDEKKILLQVSEDTQKELEKECNRLSTKLKQITKSAIQKRGNQNINNNHNEKKKKNK